MARDRREYNKKYRADHKEEIKKKDREYYLKNREYLIKYNNLYRKIKYREDPEYRDRVRRYNKWYDETHPEHTAKRRAYLKKYRDDPERKAKQREYMRAWRAKKNG